MTILFLFVICSSACAGFINSSPDKSSTLDKFASTTSKIESVDSNLLTSNPTQTDSIIYNKYKNGKKDGLWKEFDENNQLIAEGYYKNGKANGLMKWYHEGNLVASGNMKDDKRNGLWKICDFNIILNCTEATFMNDQKVGIWKILHDNGKVSKEQYWDLGKMISEKCWDENSNRIDCK